MMLAIYYQTNLATIIFNTNYSIQTCKDFHKHLTITFRTIRWNWFCFILWYIQNYNNGMLYSDTSDHLSIIGLIGKQKPAKTHEPLQFKRCSLSNKSIQNFKPALRQIIWSCLHQANIENAFMYLLNTWIVSLRSSHQRKLSYLNRHL